MIQGHQMAALPETSSMNGAEARARVRGSGAAGAAGGPESGPSPDREGRA